jgi:hypothetical protein
MTIAGPVAGPGPVEIPDQRAETVTAFRHPDGARTVVLSSGPIRLRKGTDWQPIDLTLRRDPDGGIRPVAHPDTLWLSGGGRPADAAAVRGSDGTNIALPWDAPLPAPTLTGNRAVYPNARPGADLVIEATRTGYVASLESAGGGSTHLPPATRPAPGSHSKPATAAPPGAAARPAPARTKPDPAAAETTPTAAAGPAQPAPAATPPDPAAAQPSSLPAAVQPDAAAASPAPVSDPDAAPAPASTSAGPTPAVPAPAAAEPGPPSVLPPAPMAEAPTTSAAAPTPAAPTPGAPTATASSAGAPDPSGTTAPKVTPLTLRVTHPGGTTPGSPATADPGSADPGSAGATAPGTATAAAADGQPASAPELMAGPPGAIAVRSVLSRVVANTSGAGKATLPFGTTVQSTVLSSDLSGDPDLKLGSYDGHSVARAYLSWDLSRLRGQRVMAATLRLYADWSSSCQPSGWELWSSPAVGPATRWANQPAAERSWASSTATLGHDAHCQPGWTSVNLTDLVKSWVASGATSGTVQLRATNESDPASWKRFSSGAGTNVPALGITLAP